MTASPIAVEISDTDLGALRRYVGDVAGIVVHDHQLDDLRGAVQAACTRFGLADGAAYLAQLQSVDAKAPEREFLISQVTIGESFFFRDEKQISFLRNKWIPRVVEEKRRAGDRSLRIWCAGCSNGQEPYTVAMLLQQEIPDLDGWDVEILGTDINADVLRTAMAGRYGEWSFRATPPKVRSRFFTAVGHDFEITAKIRDMVRFSYLNLVADPFPSLLNQTTSQDLILCRNVFIYFERDMVDAIVSRMASCLVPGGHLVVGAADPVGLDYRELIYSYSGGAGYFRRVTATGPALPPAPARHSQMSRPSLVSLVAPSVAKPATKPAEKPAPPSLDGSDVVDLIRREDWQKALDAINGLDAQEAMDGDMLRAKAKVLANMGRAEEALGVCEALTAGDHATDKHNFFMMGLVALDMGDDARAEKAFRQTLFLDHGFVEAHFQLALILLRADKRGAGVKSLANALSLARRAPEDRVIHESRGMTMGRFIATLEQTLEQYGSAPNHDG